MPDPGSMPPTGVRRGSPLGAAAAAEERFRRVVDHISDALIMDDRQGRVLYANPAFLRLFGLDAADLDGLALEDYVAPEHRQLLRERHDRRIGGEEVPAHFEYVGVKKDGTRMSLEVVVVPVIEDGVVCGTQSAIRDVTSRKRTERALRESEGKYRRLVENLRTEYFFYSHGPDGVFTWVSPSIENILGYSVEEFLKHYADFFTDNPINEAARRHSERSCAGEEQPPYALEVLHRCGDRRMLEVNESPVFDGDGHLVAVEGIAH